MDRSEFHARRARLLASITRPVLLFAGGHISRNYPHNAFPFRADSNFLYFFDEPEPSSAALFDPDARSVTLFLPARTVENALWDGEVPSFEAMREHHGVDAVLPVEELEEHVKRLVAGRSLDSVAVADPKTTSLARAITGKPLDFDDAKQVAAPNLIQAIARLRLHKSAAEVAEMRRCVEVTREAHLDAMRASKPGVGEELLAGLVEGAFARYGCVPAYGTILSVRGEVLHIRSHKNVLQLGDIVLNDAGAEGQRGYCADVTRCWPVGGPFSKEGAEVYDLVLAANEAAIAMVRPGVRYREIHLAACRVIADGLLAMGLIEGSVDAIVESGAHAVFFPHGVGHQLGIDVHDMETFGDAVFYPHGRERSTQFGTRYLRMDMDLEPGMTFTIEPGLYFVPAILRSPELRARFSSPGGPTVRFDRAERFLAMNGGRGFGGIRIEDNVLCTESGHEVLTRDIPKARRAVEALVGQSTPAA